MPIDRKTVERIVRYNRRVIGGLRDTLDRKLISFIGWLYRNLELGPAWERRLRDRLAGRAVPEIVEALRPVLGRLSDAVRAGRASARGYASMVVREYDSAREIEALDTRLPEIGDDLEYFRAAVSLKRDREIPFLQDLLRHLLSYLPTDRRGIAEAERVLRLVRKHLEDLLKMVGTLEGRVSDADTREPIEGAAVEVAGLRGVADREGRYRIDFVPAGRHRAACSAPGYEAAEADVEIRGGEVTIHDWYLKKMVVVTRVLQSRMFYRSYVAYRTPQPFAFLVVFVKTRKPDDPLYSEDSFRSALDYLTHDPECFPTLGMALVSISEKATRRGVKPAPPAVGGAFFVDGREVRGVDWDEVGEEAKKFGISAEELIDQVRYYCAFYRIKNNVARIYREYLGKLEFREGRWVIIPDWERTRVEPRQLYMPELGAPSPEELEV
jgi:hypothetical protein